MLKVAYLIKFLTEINPHTSPTRLALYNYLKAFHSPEEELSDGLISEFFYQCLEYSHWYSNRGHLSHEIQILLKNFNDFYQNHFDLSKITFPDQIQIIEVESPKSVEEILTRYIRARYVKEVKFKIFTEQKKWFAFILKDGSGIDVLQLDRKFTIRNGVLEPLRTQLKISFDSSMELDSQFVHTLEVSAHHLMQFTIKGGLITGALTRGYMFQKSQDIQNAKLHDIPKLFWPVKRIEQFFVSRSTDPFYGDIVKKLEDITLGFWEKNSESWQNYITILLSQSESALENVYVGDKRLEDLIRKVRHLLVTTQNDPAKSGEPWQKNQIKPQLNPQLSTKITREL